MKLDRKCFATMRACTNCKLHSIYTSLRYFDYNDENFNFGSVIFDLVAGNTMQLFGAYYTLGEEAFFAGSNFRIPYPALVPGSAGSRLSSSSHGRPCGVPDTSFPLNEFEHLPGKYWCYQMQTYGLKHGQYYGDYL